MEQVLVGNEAKEADAVRDAGMLRRLAHAPREPGLLAGQYQFVWQVGLSLDQPRKSFDQSDMVLARLQVTNRKDERRRHAESRQHFGGRRLVPHLMKASRRRVMHYRDAVRI